MQTYDVEVLTLEIDTSERTISARTKRCRKGSTPSYATRGGMQEHHWICTTLLAVVRYVNHDSWVDCAFRECVSDEVSRIRSQIPL